MPKTKGKYSPKAIIQSMKKEGRHSLIFSINLALVSVAVFAVAFFNRAFLYILIPFILMPWALASMIMIMNKEANEVSSPSYFFRAFGVYYRNNILGSYRIIRNFLISFLCSALLGGVAALIYYAVSVSTGGELVDDIQKLMFLITTGDNEGLQLLLSTDCALTEMLAVSTAVELASFFMFFVHYYGVYSINAVVQVAATKVDNINIMFTKTIKANRKAFFKMYYGYLWPLLVIEVVALVGGFFLSLLIPNTYIEQNVIFAVGFSIAILSLLFGYYVHALHAMSEPYIAMTLSFLVQSGREAMNDPKFVNSLSEEEKAALEEQIDKMNRMVNDENSDCNSPESGDNNGTEKGENDHEN